MKRPALRSLLPVLAISTLLVVSFLVPSRGNFPFNGKLVACTGYGSGYGYAGGPPTVTDVNWSLGSATGGQSVTITGKGFCGGGPSSAVKFGTWSAAFTVNSDTSITATVPATSPANTYGVVDVTVMNTLGTSAVNAGDRFAYLKSALYNLDGWGGFNTVDSPSITGTSPSYWQGWRIARAAHAYPLTGAAQKGFTLDGYGGLHPYGPTPPAETSGAGGHYWGWDIARDFAFMPDGSGGILMDGFGGLHGFGVNGGVAPVPQGFSYWAGWDVAIKVVIAADGKGGYTLDAYGGLHPFGIGGAFIPTQPIQSTSYWGWRAAIDMALVPGQNGGYSGYVLDRFGGAHPFAPTGTTLPANIVTSYWGWDIARGIFFISNSSTDGYTFDGYGGPHPFGNAPNVHQYPYWGWDIGIAMVGS